MDIAQKVSLARELIGTANKKNHFITIDFIKKSTGELRKMQCHRSKILESTVLPYRTTSSIRRDETLKSRNIIQVEELTKTGQHQFRSIPLENIVSISYGGRKYDMVNGEIGR